MADGFGVGVMGWSPMGGGLLTGKYRKGDTGRVLHADQGRDVLVIDELIAIVDELGANAGQVAIAWVSAKGVLPVIGPRTRAQFDDNLAATTITLGTSISAAWRP